MTATKSIFETPATSILGSPLPDTPLGWLGALLIVWAGLFGGLQALETFIDHNSGRTGSLSGVKAFVLPAGWVLWGFALLYADFEALPVLIVLFGLAIILIAQLQLRRARR